MERQYINCLVFDGETLELRRIKDDLPTYHEIINCTSFEGYSGTEIGLKYGLDIYLDGNGKIRDDKPKLVGLFVEEKSGKVLDTLVGTLLIARHDEDGDSMSVNNLDKYTLEKHIVERENTNVPDIWKDGFGEFVTTSKLLVLKV